MKRYYFTSESVTEGHPDKLCDLISDSILDEYLKQDENSRVAIETFASKNRITIAGQVTSNGDVNIENINSFISVHDSSIDLMLQESFNSLNHIIFNLSHGIDNDDLYLIKKSISIPL